MGHCVYNLFLFRTLPDLFTQLICWLELIHIVYSQFDQCDYVQNMKIGKSYDVFNPNYPSYYPSNTACRWTGNSDRPIRMTCDIFELPESPKCSVDVIIIRKSDGSHQRYCGRKTFSVISQDNQIIIELYSSPSSSGGRFFCKIQAVNVTTDDECRCGWENLSRIVAGEDTGINEYPMMAGLVDLAIPLVFCGATIVNNQQVLTAAHCVYKKNIKEIAVLVGDHDLDIGSETEAQQLYKILKIHIYPQYSEYNLDDDIALINIQGSIQFNLQIGPACLPIQHSSDSFAENSVIILGWGSIGAGEKKSNILQQAKVKVISNSECSRTYNDITTKQMCTLDKARDSCQYDSGGPVLWINPRTSRINIVSIISSGGICADGNPSINTRVSTYIDWILTQTPPGFLYCANK